MKNIVLTGLALLALGCTSNLSAQETTMGQHKTKTTAIKMAMIASKAEDISPLLIGEGIPNGILLDSEGNSFDVNKAVSERLTILVFYRGGWCPYCSAQLAGLQEILPAIEELGYQLIAISTDSPEELFRTQTKEKLRYKLLSDSDLSYSKEFGIAFKAPEKYENMLDKSSKGLNMESLLPVPSVFLVDTKGEIKFEYISPNYKHRLNQQLLLRVAEEIKLGR